MSETTNGPSQQPQPQPAPRPGKRRPGGIPLRKGFDPRRHIGKGRPPKPICIPDILRKIGAETMDTPEGKMQKLEAVCRLVFKYAAAGDSWAVQFIADRTEGKPIARIETETRQVPTLRVEMVTTGAPPETVTATAAAPGQAEDADVTDG